MLVLRKLLEDDLKEVETYWNLSGLYVKMYILIRVHLLALSVKILSGVMTASKWPEKKRNIGLLF